MIRGIEGRRIFLGPDDRIDLLERLDRLLPELAFRCLGWVLMPNHVHLIVQSGSVRLSRLMARLGTGYARSFNLRHQRKGYLFQNRFRSRIVASDADLLAVVRYLYRNPLEAGIVGSVAELAGWPWSGFPALMGTRPPRPFEAVGATLALFDDEPENARRRLVELVSRSEVGEADPAVHSGALSPAFEMAPNELSRSWTVDCRTGSARHNGSADASTDAQLRSLIEEVCRDHGLDPSALDPFTRARAVSRSELAPRTRARAVSRARAIISYRAIVERYIPGLAVAKALGVTPSAVSHMLKRGQALCPGDPAKLH
jgi:REP element-mobilizing transposase RayT